MDLDQYKLELSGYLDNSVEIHLVKLECSYLCRHLKQSFCASLRDCDQLIAGWVVNVKLEELALPTSESKIL